MSVRVAPEIQMSPERWQRTDVLQRELAALRNDHERRQRDVGRVWWDGVKRLFVLTDEHVLLLSHMRFELVEGTDLACIAADGKRPFGNGDWVKDIIEILGWTPEYDADGLTGSVIERAQRIMAELPLALNQIVRERSGRTA